MDLIRVNVEGGRVIAQENPKPQTPNPKAYTPNEEDLFVVGFDRKKVVARLDRLVLGAGLSGSGKGFRVLVLGFRVHSLGFRV